MAEARGQGEVALAGRTVLITGASSGLGAHFTRLCLDHGAAVVPGARRIDLLESLAVERTADRDSVSPVALDVTCEASIQNAFDHAERVFGIVDTVIVNAGIELSGPAIDLPVEAWDQVFAVNVRGAFLTAREAARRLLASGQAERGRIVLVSSITARKTDPGIAPYSASKAALSHLGRVLAREWVRTGPNVNSLAPGYIATEMTAEWFQTETGQRQVARFPRRRLMDQCALDSGLLYLASDSARHTTGAEITVDDGQSL